MKHWRTILAHLPLPMLGLAASYGVYSFALLYAPLLFALAQAAAFELTYIGLATLVIPNSERQRYARRISVGAVVVSVLYNSAAGFFHRNPAALSNLGLWGEIVLAVAHGAPLALVAYFVADLLLHTSQAPQPAPQPVVVTPQALPAETTTPTPQPTSELAQLKAHVLAGRRANPAVSWSQLAGEVGRSVSTIRGWVESPQEG